MGKEDFLLWSILASCLTMMALAVFLLTRGCA